MNKALLTLITIFAITITTNAQSIETKKVFGGYKYSQGENKLTMGELYRMMKPESESYYIMKKAKGSATLATIIGSVGGFGLGYGIGSAIGGGDIDWGIVGAGAGLIVISAPIAAGASKKAKRAVDLHNAGLTPTATTALQPEFSILANSKGVGLSVQF